MALNGLTLIFVAKDQPDLDAFDWSCTKGVAVKGIRNARNEPLSVIANSELDLCETAVFGLCHADAVFGPGALDAFTAEAMAGAVCGIVGRDMQEVYRCSWLDSRDSWWSDNVLTGGPGPVSTLDGMAIFFRRDTALRFDSETFDGLHCHVEDLCLQAHAYGLSVVVPRADAYHRNHHQAAKFLLDYQRYRAKLEAKWKGTAFRTT